MLFKNTLAQSSAVLTAYGLSVILAPIMLSRLGVEQFGVWAVTGATMAYAGLADFGITRALSRFVALYDARGDTRAIKESIGLGLVAMTGVGAIATVIAILTAPLFSASLGVLSTAEMRIVLVCAVANFVFQAYRRVLNSLETGLQRMVPPNVANVFTNVLNFAFSVGILLVHPTLVAYAIANAASYLVGIGASLVSVFYVWRSFPFALPRWGRAREILSFSAKTQVHALADLVNLQTDKIIIGFYVGVRAVATYEIAARVVVAVRAVGFLTISAMIPTFTAHIAKHGGTAISEFYRRYTRLTTALAFPIFAVTCITAPFLLHAWLGNVLGDGPLVVAALTFAYLLTVTIEVGRNIATAEGNPGLVATNSGLTAGLNVVLTVVLAPLLGFWGVLGGTVIALSLGCFVFVARFHRRYGLPLREYTRAVAPSAALTALLAAPFVVWDLVHGQAHTRLEATVTLAAMCVGYGAPYWLIASRRGLLPARLTLPFARPRRPPVATA